MDLGALNIELNLNDIQLRKTLTGTEKRLEDFDQKAIKLSKEATAKYEADVHKLARTYIANGMEIKDATQLAADQIDKRQYQLFDEMQENLRKSKEEAKKAAEAAKKAAKEASDTAKEEFKKASEAAKKGAAAAGKAIASLAASIVGVVAGTKEWREEQAKLNTAWSNAGRNAEDAKNIFNDLYGVIGEDDKVVEAAGHIAKMSKNTKEDAKWTRILTGVYSTFGDSLPIESLTEAANETAKTGVLTGALADALNWAGYSEEEFQKQMNNCNDEREREIFIMDTLNELHGSAADIYKAEHSNLIEMNDANRRLKETLGLLGDALAPLVAAGADMLNKLMLPMANWLEENPEKVERMQQAVEKFGQFIIDNKDTIIAGLVGIGTGLLAFKVANIITACVGAIKAFSAATAAATAAQEGLNIAMMANPIGLVVGLIAGLVAAIVTLWTTNEDFRNKIKGLWNDLSAWWSNLIDGLAQDIQNLIDKWNSFWSSANDTHGVEVPPGFHRNGLRSVPYDGYRAILHQGEMILTNAEAKRYKKDEGSATTATHITVNNYSPKALNEAESARQFKKAQRQLALGM